MRKTLPEKKPIDGVAKVLMVGSGKGGVGKSTVAVNLAVALARRGHKTGLLDADIYGPSVPTMLGLEGAPQYQEGKIQPFEKFGIKALSIGNLSQGPIVWRGLLVMKALQQLVRDVNWGKLDYLVIDLPPGTGDVHLSLMQTVPISTAILVTTPQTVSWIDVKKAAQMFQLANIPVLGYVQNMVAVECPKCSHHFELFPNKSHQFTDYKCLLKVPFDPKISIDMDKGETRTDAFNDLASHVTNTV
jgi:ATP-binding protein involved in chromosome partitioning